MNVNFVIKQLLYKLFFLAERLADSVSYSTLIIAVFTFRKKLLHSQHFESWVLKYSSMAHN